MATLMSTAILPSAPSMVVAYDARYVMPKEPCPSTFSIRIFRPAEYCQAVMFYLPYRYVIFYSLFIILYDDKCTVYVC